jgi:hypothetical protein
MFLVLDEEMRDNIFAMMPEPDEPEIPQQQPSLDDLLASGFAVLKTVHDSEAALGVPQASRTSVC